MTDERRREIAARLRCADASSMCDLTDSAFIDALASLIGFESDDGECYEASLLEHLADLIDRPVCHPVDVPFGYGDFALGCSVCGEPLNVNLRTGQPYRRCMSCGAEVIA